MNDVRTTQRSQRDENIFFFYNFISNWLFFELFAIALVRLLYVRGQRIAHTHAAFKSNDKHFPHLV